MMTLFVIGALALNVWTALSPEEWSELADKMDKE